MLQQLLMNREDFLKTGEEEEEGDGGLARPSLARTRRPAGHQRPRAGQSRAGRMPERPSLDGPAHVLRALPSAECPPASSRWAAGLVIAGRCQWWL